MVILPPPVPPSDMTAGDYYPVTNGTTVTITYTSSATDATATIDEDTIWTDEGATVSSVGYPVYYSDPEPAAKPPEWPAMFAIWEEPVSLPVDHKDRPRSVRHLAFTVWARAPPGSSVPVLE